MRFRRRDSIREDARRLFEPVAVAVDAAQRALLAAVPTSRHPGAPLAAALDTFDATLTQITDAMNGWRDHAPTTEWGACASGLERASAEAAALRTHPPGPTAFEELNARIGDVLAHLDVFADTERALR